MLVLPKQKGYYVYILRCQDDSLYTGWTNDLPRRFSAHQKGMGARYTKAHPPKECVYYEVCIDKSSAMKREYAIKQLSHQEKEALIKNQDHQGKRLDRNMNIRKATSEDLSRIAEIYVFNNRLQYFPIFKDEMFSFKELQVVSVMNTYFKKEEILSAIYVYDDGIIRGFLQMQDKEICKLYVDPCFQNNRVGNALITFAMDKLQAKYLWALEKNTRAISFYQRHGFQQTGDKKFEEDTTEYLAKLER